MDKCIITREVWYPDATSWRTSVSAALDAGATGVAVWALGYESPEARDAIADLSVSVAGPDGTEPVGKLGRVRVGDEGRLRVRGWAFDPEGDLPISVTVTLTSLDDPAATPDTRTLLARDPRPALLRTHPGAGEFHAFKVRLQPSSGSGDYRVCLDATGRYDGPNLVRLRCRNVTVPGDQVTTAGRARN